MVYAVDIDGTICLESEHWWEYDKALPIASAIEKVNNLFLDGHTIILFSARFHCDEKVTMDWLKEQGVRYHMLVLGKVKADVYIDNASLRMEEL